VAAVAMTMVDFHIHTTLSCDGHCTVDEICRKAIEIGLRAICFTEHLDLDPADPGYGFLDYEEYGARLEEARQRYAGSLTILKGIEADYQSRFEDRVREWLIGKELDLVIGSVHYVDGTMLSEEMLAGRDLDEVYLHYLEEVRLSAESGLFGAIGHLDYIKKFTGDASYLDSNERLRPPLEKALLAIIASGAALEISTKGLVAKSRDYRPSLNIVRFYKKLGGRKVTIGSDAHDCQVLGTGAGRLLRTCDRMGLDVIRESSESRPYLAAGSRQKRNNP
jgi:histidinol-phosphatase (PHP family)